MGFPENGAMSSKGTVSDVQWTVRKGGKGVVNMEKILNDPARELDAPMKAMSKANDVNLEWE